MPTAEPVSPPTLHPPLRSLRALSKAQIRPCLSRSEPALTPRGPWDKTTFLTLFLRGLALAEVFICHLLPSRGGQAQRTIHLASKAPSEFSCLWAFAHTVPSTLDALPLEAEFRKICGTGAKQHLGACLTLSTCMAEGDVLYGTECPSALQGGWDTNTLTAPRI